jgi:hypothetical protein
MRPGSPRNLRSEKRRSSQPRPACSPRSPGTPSCAVTALSAVAHPAIGAAGNHPTPARRLPDYPGDHPWRSHQRARIKPSPAAALDARGPVFYSSIEY